MVVFKFLCRLLLASKLKKSICGHFDYLKTYVPHDRIKAHNTLMDDYIRHGPKYNKETFRARFCISKELFMKIVDGIDSSFE